ncbi:Crp/Fnr family transcriptional regulator [Azospirillum sp. RWY-5-1]|uniref:Crp/Fnr family transcriptional regulator n=1 Tax=Azospirillum oleiclasticum TaxID=2735135 RepID=A0ABX2TFF4_9PROT|nr:Crp/Fnr family transcriptional regulator [Azospirillum oleiclasticum]NYZ17221.1 Crp/Fnr family transcriptional regulator [Azospirillum oleiclasticum]NYZ23070.1 Crp/Fnr family transcriptional regulator [Azospirillum oleiclasticum]
MGATLARPDAEAVGFVRTQPFFRALDERAFDRLVRAAGLRVLDAGEDLFLQDDETDEFFVLISGTLELYRTTADGEEALIRIVGRAEAFSSGLTLSFGPNPFSARAVGSARVITGSRAALLALMRVQGAAAVDFASSMSSHIRQFADHIEELQVQPALQRLTHFLERTGIEPRQVDAGALPYKKVVIARAIGVAPETLSRLLGKLRHACPDARPLARAC